jgi:hypothetical protein
VNSANGIGREIFCRGNGELLIGSESGLGTSDRAPLVEQLTLHSSHRSLLAILRRRLHDSRLRCEDGCSFEDGDVPTGATAIDFEATVLKHNSTTSILPSSSPRTLHTTATVPSTIDYFSNRTIFHVAAEKDPTGRSTSHTRRSERPCARSEPRSPPWQLSLDL